MPGRRSGCEATRREVAEGERAIGDLQGALEASRREGADLLSKSRGAERDLEGRARRRRPFSIDL